jgi:predicted O-methyltransferase YrrM
MSKFWFVRCKDFIHYYLIQPYKKGKGIKTPEILEFVNRVLSNASCPIQDEINHIRKELLQNQTILHINDYGAGSKSGQTNNRKVCDIARMAASSDRKGKLLYNLVEYLNPKTVIELGTSLGLGTLYMAKASPSTIVYTIEGSAAIQQVAIANFQKTNTSNINAIQGKFEDVLPGLLGKMNESTLIFIDGNHTYQATINYFNLILEKLHHNAILIFDDIRWSEGMYSAWLDICVHPQVNISIDLLSTGIVFINHKISKQHFRIYY